MQRREIDLSKYTVGNFQRGAGRGREAAWILTSLLLFRLNPLKLSKLKCFVLRCFGAQVGRGVVIKPHVTITFPWKLSLGDHVWLGEQSFLLNLAQVTIGNNVCISQRAFLCTGNHDYKSATFDLVVKPIEIADGAWIGAGAMVGPGVNAGSHSVLAAGSVANREMQPFGIYQGNPAVFRRTREIREGPSIAGGAG